MAVTITITMGDLGAGYCWPASPQQFANDMAAKLSGQFPSNITTFNYGDTTPTAAQQAYPWLRTISGAPDRWYVYFNGQWVWKHEIPASAQIRIMWVGSLADLQTYDGGTTDPVSATAGPFWEEDTALRAHFPVGVGSFPSGDSVAVTGTGGAEKTTLTMAELPTDVSIPHQQEVPGPNLYIQHDTSDEGDIGVNRDTASNIDGSGDSFTNLPPYYGVYFIKRTARIYRVAS